MGTLALCEQKPRKYSTKHWMHTEDELQNDVKAITAGWDSLFFSASLSYSVQGLPSL
jgi:hypothetical protein